MNKTNLFLLLAILYLWVAPAAAQQQAEIPGLDKYFSEAYSKYPTIPEGILEAAAYAASRMNNLTPHEGSDHTTCTGQPERYGLFGLVEDGQDYFKNNLLDVCKLSNITPARFKKDVRLQILAVAKFLSREAGTQRLAVGAEAESFAGVLESLSEIPDDGSTVNAHARTLYTYDVYYHLKHGFSMPSLKQAPADVQMEKIYPAATLRTLQAPGVEIDYDNDRVLTPGDSAAPAEKDTDDSAGDGVSLLSTDYGPALWDQAHTNNWSTSRNGSTATNVTIHTAQGSYAGTISWFNNGNQRDANGNIIRVSAHYVIRSSDGQVTQMVREAYRAYHVLNHNNYTIGIEHEGFVNNASWYTTSMYNSSAALVRDICSSWNIDASTAYSGPASSGTNYLPASVRIKGHQHYSGNNHTDPGINWNWSRYYDLINPPTSQPGTIVFTTKGQASGAALANAAVTITAPNGSTSTEQTNGSGKLVFDGDAGTYSFAFSASGYETINTHFTVVDDETITADINMDLTSAGNTSPAGVPATIRVATNCACGSCSDPVVQVMSLEAYVQTGVDDEWIASWPAASLQAGAVAYRSRGAFYAQNPVADNYDVSDAACHQTWQDDRATSVKDAAIATAGIVLTKNGVIVRPEYGAETNNGGCGNGYSGTGSTAHPCIADERCVGRANNGGGEGMCQWGSSFWATDHDYAWILDHYYAPAGIIIATPAPTTPITFNTKSQETGTAVGGASVTVVDPNGASSTLATNSSGTLVFAAGPGEYTFTFSASGYAPLTTRFTGGDEEEAITADINMDLSSAASPSVPGVPDAIRVATNCACAACPDPVVQVMSLEAYVQTGVDDEWLSSWPAASLQAGAVAYRSRGAFYAQNPVGDNYDVSAAACHQTWQDDRATSVKNAAIATAGVVLVKDGAIVRPDYGAETNNGGCGDGYSGTGTTDHPCIADDRCVGRANSGGGEGMCQWGSSFWATDHNYTWILDHYYSPAGISIQAPTAALVAASSTASEEAESNSYLVVSPNPITGHEVKVGYTLQGDAQAALIMLTDNGGQPLQQKKVNLQNGYNEVMLETATLRNGIYVVTIQLASGRPESKKLIVDK